MQAEFVSLLRLQKYIYYTKIGQMPKSHQKGNKNAS